MNEELQQFIDSLEAQVGVGKAVSYTLSTDGWQRYVVPALKEFITNISNIDNIETQEQLLARKEAVQIFVKFQTVLDGFIDQANVAATELERQD